MRALEANSDYFGVSYGELMENAGRKAAETIISRFRRCTVLVVCGTGNNGGDGFVIARYLATAGFMTFVRLLGRSSDVKKGPASANLERLRAIGIEVREAPSPETLSKHVFEGSDIIVDAMLGTGVKGELREPYRTAIDLINKTLAVKVSIDIPGGLDPDTGLCSRCVNADLVLTLHAPKVGLDRFNVETIDIGIPDKATQFVGPGDLQNIRTRGDYTHKGESGRVLVVGGGPYTGAPALTALAALRAGADIVTVAAPGRAAEIIATFSPDLIVKPTTHRDVIAEADADLLAPLIEKSDVVIIGMGLGDAPETTAAASRIIDMAKNTVIDADALRPGVPLKGIITPHRGEFRRISGVDLPDDQEHAIEAVKNFSSSANVVTLLKGRVDIISDGDTVRLNSTGNAGMTVGGTGDVLAGIAGAMLCRNRPLDAACVAAFLNGAAGDMVLEDKGYGMLATDVINMIPYAVKKYRRSPDTR